MKRTVERRFDELVIFRMVTDVRELVACCEDLLGGVHIRTTANRGEHKEAKKWSPDIQPWRRRSNTGEGDPLISFETSLNFCSLFWAADDRCF